MNKKFIKYSVIAAALTYTVLFVNMNLSPKYISRNRVSAVSVNTDHSAETLAEGGFFTPCMSSDGNRLLYSSGDNIYEMDLVKKDIVQLTTMGNCYNPVYYGKDNNIIAFARNDGIYKMDKAAKKIIKAIGSEDPQVSFAKPNFTPEEDIVFFKVIVEPSPEGHGFIEKQPSIYRLSKDGSQERKLIEGYNPTLSKDGSSLLYEMKDNIYVMDIQTKDSKLIDKGKYAAWSNAGNYISYARFEREVVPYTRLKGKRKLFIDKEYSNIYIADIKNPKNKKKLTSEEFDKRDKELESWAEDTKSSPGEQHFLLVSKVAYFDSEWSKEDKELYISVYDSDTGSFKLLKYKLN